MTLERPIGDDDLQAAIDGRLTGERRLAVEAYLAAHPGVAADVTADIDATANLRARLAGKGQEPIPARLRIANIVAGRRQRMLRQLSATAAALVLLVLGAGAGWLANNALRPVERLILAADEPATNDAIAAYRTFVGEKLHPVEVAADQEAHLVQWLSRRLGKPLSAPDLTGQGYRLMGGRLLPAGQGPAAMFMYADETGNRLTLYARAGAPDALAGFQFERDADVSAFTWIDRTVAYVVTAHAERQQLLAIAENIHRQLGTGTL